MNPNEANVSDHDDPVTTAQCPACETRALVIESGAAAVLARWRREHERRQEEQAA